jgi:hypothetical protein
MKARNRCLWLYAWLAVNEPFRAVGADAQNSIATTGKLYLDEFNRYNFGCTARHWRTPGHIHNARRAAPGLSNPVSRGRLTS